MAGKKITELTQANVLTDTDLFIVETNEGTRTVPYSMMKSSSDAESINCAASHNAVFRGKDLTNVYTIDEICNRISNGTFEDLYIGDYFDITINVEGSESVRCVLAGFNTYIDKYTNNNTNIRLTNHVVIVTNALNTLYKMCDDNVDVLKGYKGSKMWNTTIPLYNTAFSEVFDSHLIPYGNYFTSEVDKDLLSNVGKGNKGASCNQISVNNIKLDLLNEVEIFGMSNFSSSYLDVEGVQLPLFKLNQQEIFGKKTSNNYFYNYWLKNVSSFDSFAIVNMRGNCSFMSANQENGFRPKFIIG